MAHLRSIEMALDDWEKRLGTGGSIPLAEVRALLSPDDIEYVKRHYFYDPIRRGIFNIATGICQDGPAVSCGSQNSPVSLRRAEWFLRVGDRPVRVGKDQRGRLWGVYEKGGTKVYAE